MGHTVGDRRTDHLVEVGVGLTVGWHRGNANFGQQFAQTRLRPGRSGRIAQFKNTLGKRAKTIEHARHWPLRSIDARSWWAVLARGLATLLFTRWLLLIARLLIARLLIARLLIARLLITRWLLLIARLLFARLLITLQWALVSAWRTLVCGGLAFATVRCGIRCGIACGTVRLSLSGGFLFVTVGILTVGIVLLRIHRQTGRIVLAVERRQRITICITTTAATTATTTAATALTRLTGIARLPFVSHVTVIV
jgi:hypothetical protein